MSCCFVARLGRGIAEWMDDCARQGHAAHCSSRTQDIVKTIAFLMAEHPAADARAAACRTLIYALQALKVTARAVALRSQYTCFTCLFGLSHGALLVSREFQVDFPR